MHRIRGRAFTAALLLAVAACDDADHGTAPPSPPSAAEPLPAPAAVTHPGVWSAPIAWPIVTAHLVMLPNGRVLGWTSDDSDHAFHTDNVHVWDPGSGAFTQVPNTNTDLFCSAHAFLADGRLMVSGGHIQNDHGVKDANIFTPVSQTWGRAASMRAGRWYPTSLALANGELLTLGGSDENAIQNPYPEVWTGSGWRLLGDAHKVLPYYPWVHAAPDGRVFISGPGGETLLLSTAGNGGWSDGPVSSRGRSAGTSVMYAPGKVLIVGGGDPPTNTAEIIDLAAGTGWRATGSMQYPRRHLNAVVLADGRVLAVGGTSGAGFNDETRSVLAAELWDPQTGAWTTLASMTIARQYHSATVLLPDGRVLASGGGRAGPAINHPDAQLFTPPYLLNADGSAAPRPTISSAPSSAGHGQTISIGTPDPAAIARVTLLALSSTTHGFDMGQRFVELAFTRGSGALGVTMPAGGTVAPPGPYMLFVLNAAGVPSVARMINLSASAPPPPSSAPAAPGGLAATVASISQIDLSWTDNSSNETGFQVERCQGAGCTDFSLVATVPAGGTAHRSSGLAASASYSFRVRAVNTAGSSAWTGVASGTTNAWHAPTGGEIVNRASGTCMDVDAWNMDPGGRIIIWPCHGGANQSWTRPPDGTIGEFRVYGTLCLDDGGGQGLDGDPIITWTCHGLAPQQWMLTAAGELKLVNGKCIELAEGNTAQLTPLILMPCNGAMTQKWAVASAAPVNQAPSAAFTPACTELTCTFTDGSADADGQVVAWSWNFGDGSTSTVRSPSRTYAAGGTYTVALTVTDDDGATASTTRTVTVSASPPPPPPPPPGGISLTATGRKSKGYQYVDLRWTGAAGTNVDVYRDGTLLVTTANDGAHTDDLRRKGGGSYRYRLCEAGTSTCSSEVTVVF